MGSGSGSVDMDPGGGTALLADFGSFGAFMLRLDAGGGYVTALGYGDPVTAGEAVGFDAIVNVDGAPWMAGYFTHTLDPDRDCPVPVPDVLSGGGACGGPCGSHDGLGIRICP